MFDRSLTVDAGDVLGMTAVLENEAGGVWKCFGRLRAPAFDRDGENGGFTCHDGRSFELGFNGNSGLGACWNSEDQQQKEDQSKQDEKSQEQKQDNPSQDEQKKSEEEKQRQQQEQQQKQQDQQKQDQANKSDQPPSKEGENKESEDKEPQADSQGQYAQLGKMTPAQAKQLLDAQKGEEKALIFVPPDRKSDRQPRSFKDW